MSDDTNFSMVARTAAFCVGAVIVVLVYLQGLNGPFMFDDLSNIPQARVSDPSQFGSWVAAVMTNYSGELGRPISVLTFALNHLISSEPYGFKAVNLVLHLVTALLLCVLAVRLCNLPHPLRDQRIYWLLGGACALAWALHPLQISTVLYAVQRMAILAALFNVAAMLCYVSLRARLMSGAPGALRQAALLAMFSALAVFSKETGALLPFYVLALELSLFRFRTHDDQARRFLLGVMAVFVALPLALGVVYFLTHLDTLASDYDHREFTLGERLLTQADAVWFYLKLMLLPDITRMSIYHDDYPIAVWGWVSAIKVAGVVALAAAVLLVRHRWPLVAFGIMWFFASHAIESTVIPLELVFEHRNYLALFGIVLPIFYYLVVAARNAKARMIGTGALVVFALLLTFQTLTRAATWADERLLVAVVAHEHPNSARARHEYGRFLIDHGEYAKALEEVRAAEKLRPRDPHFAVSVLLAECYANQLSDETIERLANTLAASPMGVSATRNLDRVVNTWLTGPCPQLDRHAMLKITSGAMRYTKHEPQAWRRAAVMYYHGMVQSQHPGKWDEAMATLREATRTEPRNLRALALIGIMEYERGRIDEARKVLQEVKRRDAESLHDNSYLYAALEQLVFNGQ